MIAGVGRVHGLHDGRYLQIYLGDDVSHDSAMPLRADEDCRVEIVEDGRGRAAVVITPIEVELAAADLDLAPREVDHD